MRGSRQNPSKKHRGDPKRISRFRSTILLLTLLGATVFGLTRITLNVDVLSMLPAQLPEVDGIRKLYRHFSRSDELILLLEAKESGLSSSEDAANQPLTLAAQSLAAHLEGDPTLVRRVVWSTSFEGDAKGVAELLAYAWLNAEPAQLAALTDRLGPDHSAAVIEEAIESLSADFLDESMLRRAYDPLGFTDLPTGLEGSSVGISGQGPFVSDDGRLRALYLTAPDGRAGDYRAAGNWLLELEAAIDAWRQDFTTAYPDAPPIEIAFTGEPAFIAEIGAGIERDMHGSMTLATGLICLLFWLFHRRLLPLLWLLLVLGATFALTLAICGALFGELSIMSAGFAAILVGLAVDYAVVLYRESSAFAGDTAGLRRTLCPSILWAALTTAAVFFALRFSSFPGVSQLGVLVSIGILIGATLMLWLFAPVATRWSPRPTKQPSPPSSSSARLPWLVTAALPLTALLILALLGPPVLQDADPFQMRNSAATDAFAKMQAHFAKATRDRIPLVISAEDAESLESRTARAREILETAKSEGAIDGFLLPTGLIPHAEHQSQNAALLETWLAERSRLHQSVLDAGFTEDALILSGALFDAWQHRIEALRGSTAPWVLPSHPTARWLLERFASPTDDEVAALGQIHPLPEADAEDRHALRQSDWARELGAEGVLLSGWEAIRLPVRAMIHRDFLYVFLPIGAVLVVMLTLVFRDVRDLMLTLGSLGFVGLTVLALTLVLNVEWNAFNLCSIPILFGISLDYSIHMIFALRRNRGALAPIRRGISRALLFCGTSTAIGFGSLAFAAAEGLSGIGRICTLGILVSMTVAIGLMPHWWRAIHRVTA